MSTKVSKRRADVFFRLKQGEFIAFADGKDKKVQFKLQHIQKEKSKPLRKLHEEELQLNHQRIYREVELILKKSNTSIR